MKSGFGLSFSRLLGVVICGTATFFVSATSVAALVEEIDDTTVLVQYAPGGEPLPAYTHDLIAVDEQPVTFAQGQAAEEVNSQEYWEVAVPDGEDASSFIEELQLEEGVAVVEPNRIRRTAITPDDTEYSKQWHHTDDEAGINAEEAWDITTGSEDVVVAVIDTGMDMDHPDLAANLWANGSEIAGNGTDDDSNGYVDDVNGYDFVDDDGDPDPSANGLDDDSFGGADGGVTHGTHVAGIVGAVGNNSEGIAGAAWTVSLMVLRALDDEGSGTDAAIAEAMRYAVDNGADIINMSLGGYGSTSVLQSAAEYAESNGVVILAAAGNDGVDVDDNPFYPTCYDGVLGIASSNINAAASGFSNFGSTCVDLTAPGSSIYSTLYTDDPANGFTDDYGYLSGTSMATPVAAGVAALVLAADSSLTAEQLGNVMTDSVTDIGLSGEYGAGLIDAAAAVANTDSAGRPTKPQNVQGFTTDLQSIGVAEATRSTDVDPYFTWEASTDDSAVTGYYVYFGTNASADPETAGELQTELSYQASNLSGDSVSYYLRVKSVDDEGNTSGEASSFEYIIDTVVGAAKKIQVSSAPKGVRLTWNKATGQSVQKYQIYRKVVGAEGTYERIGKVGKKKKQYVDQTARPDVVYRYKVRSVDDLKNKAFSKNKKVKFRAQERLVVAPQRGSSVVAIYNTKRNKIERQFSAFAGAFGVELAVGQFNNGRKDEIVAGVAADGPPQVRVLNARGKVKHEFMAYRTDFLGGVRVGAGNFDDDARDEIVIGPGPGHAPRIRVVERNGDLLHRFDALDGQSTSGVTVAAVQWDGVGPSEIVVGPGPGAGGDVVVYRKNGKEIARFQPYGENYNNGIRVGTATLTRNSEKEMVVLSPFSGDLPVKAYRRSGATTAKESRSFTPFVGGYAGGSSISGADVTSAGKDRLFIGSGGDRQAVVQMYTSSGNTLKDSLFLFGGNTFGLNVASGFLY